ncbi:MAG: Ig-like domain-containing protein [Thermodesulfovibrionales bacterium]
MGLTIMPSEAVKGSALTLVPRGFNIAEAEIEWLVNGVRVQTPDPQKFVAANMKKGETIQARAASKGREVLSNVVRIKNTPPALAGKVKLLPEVFKPGDLLSVEAKALDPDDDEVTIQYEWTKNGEAAGSTKTIDTPVKRDDKVIVVVTPCDSEGCGKPLTIKSTLRNLPPVIVVDKPVYQGRTYTLAFKATDPDGDQMTYSLKNAPQGCSINSTTGLITWHIPEGFTGKGSYTAVASDPKGGEASQVFNYDFGP